MLVTFSDIRENLSCKIFIFTVALTQTISLGVVCIVFPCVLWLPHPCVFILQKLCMSCHVVSLWHSWDFISSDLRPIPTISLRDERTLTQVTLALSRHANLFAQRKRRPISCVNKQELRNIFKIMATRPPYWMGFLHQTEWVLVGTSYRGDPLMWVGLAPSPPSNCCHSHKLGSTLSCLESMFLHAPTFHYQM